MRETIEQPQTAIVKNRANLTHEEKRDLIRRAIELNAVEEDIWLTYPEIAACTGLRVKDVIKTMYNSGYYFLESSWRFRNGDIMVTIRSLYKSRTSFMERVLAAFTGQND